MILPMTDPFLIILLKLNLHNSLHVYLFVLFTFRENLKILLEDVNAQKKRLKEEGILVDGKHFSVEFVGKIHISVTSVCLYPMLHYFY